MRSLKHPGSSHFSTSRSCHCIVNTALFFFFPFTRWFVFPWEGWLGAEGEKLCCCDFSCLGGSERFRKNRTESLWLTCLEGGRGGIQQAPLQMPAAGLTRNYCFALQQWSHLLALLVKQERRMSYAFPSTSWASLLPDLTTLLINSLPLSFSNPAYRGEYIYMYFPTTP